MAETGGMAVGRYPHTGLATVTLLFEGSIEHIDPSGFSNIVRPSEVNLMIAGSGLSHEEFSASETVVLHGVQPWFALPDQVRSSPAAPQHYVAEPAQAPAGTALTYIGTLAGATSTVDTGVDPHSASFVPEKR